MELKMSCLKECAFLKMGEEKRGKFIPFIQFSRDIDQAWKYDDMAFVTCVWSGTVHCQI